MDSVELITKVLAWTTTINLGLLILASVALVAVREPIARIHARMFGMSEAEVSAEYFRYLSRFKALVLIFNVAPYVALQIVG